MKFPTFYIAALAISLTLLGCSPAQPQNQPPMLPYQRFVPIAPESVMAEGIPWHGFFALDTKTGTLCVTLETKDFPKGAAEWANNVPKCNDNWRNDHN
jgi:hypothetical protein